MPSDGIIKAVVILIDQENEEGNNNVWPVNGEPNPQYTFINNSAHTTQAEWISNNISRYFYEMSNGMFQIIGDVYRFTMPENHNYTHHRDVAQDAFQFLDEFVDFSLYDNWRMGNSYNHMNVPDGMIDYVWFVYRSSLGYYFPDIWYSGVVGGFSTYVTNDVVTVNGIQKNVKALKGSTQGGYAWGFNYIQGVCVHELCHDLFWRNSVGSHNGRLTNLSPLNGNQVGYGQQIVGMNAWERERLGWISYIDISSDQTVTLSDYITSGMAVKIPVTDTKHYIIENRQKESELYDNAWGKGLYIYRAIDSGHFNSEYLYDPVHLPEPRDGYSNYDYNPQPGGYDGSINLLSAQGRYNFYNNLPDDYRIQTKSDLRIRKGEPNIKGYDVRDYCGMMFPLDQDKWNRYYAIYNPASEAPWYYTSNKNINGIGKERHNMGAAFGSIYDGFSLNYNKVISKWSNPCIDPDWSEDLNFSIEILSENPDNGNVSFRIRFDNPHEAPLARPMGLTVENQGMSCAIQWYQANHPLTEIQPGFSHYNVYYKTSISDWSLLTSTDSTNVNITLLYPGSLTQIFIPQRASFKVTAVKNNGQESNYSDIVNVNFDQNIVTPDITIPSMYSLVIDDSLSIVIDNSFIMEENSSLFLGYGSSLITNPQSSLIIGSGCTVEGSNKSQDGVLGSRFIANGNINIGTNVSFGNKSKYWDGLEITSSNPITLSQIAFMNSNLVSNTAMSIIESTFDNSAVYQKNSSLSVDNSTFNNSYINAFSKYPGATAEVYGSTFIGHNNSTDAIQLNSIDKYAIYNNLVQNYSIGISLFESTNGYIENNQLSNNKIGIQLYHAGANISNANIIENNDYGIVAFRKPLWSLEGSKSMPYQKIINNKYTQILFDYDSAPEFIEFNQIYHSINIDSPFIICLNVPSSPKKILLNNNYFGTSFNPAINFEPIDIYEHDPVWVPEDDLNNVSLIPLAYKSAKESIKNEDYLIAESALLDFYATVSDTCILFNKTSKQLLSLKKLTTNDFDNLINLYQNYTGQDADVLNLYEYLQNVCAINQSQYQTAISWLESRIDNPISYTDSLFATIDLGYLFMFIDDSKSTNINTTMSHLKPSSFSSYVMNRNNIFENLLFSQSDSDDYFDVNDAISTVTLYQNFPNPANPSTIISFTLTSAAQIELNIFNIKGQKVKTLKKGNLSKGNYNITWDGKDSNNNNVSTGIYFYQLKADNKLYARKLLLMK